MPDPATIAQDKQSTLVIPEEVREGFPDLLELIQHSESMDDEERQYWIDALPIMSEDQVENLRGILENEKSQLEEVEASYQNGLNEASEKATKAFDEVVYMEKKRARVEAEKLHEEEEREHEAQILAELENL